MKFLLIQGLITLILTSAHLEVIEDAFNGSFEEGAGVSLYVTPEGELRTIGNDWDLNDDGYLDLVVINEFELRFGKQIHDTYSYVFWGGEDGFNRSFCDSFPTHGAECAALADFNSDGWTDIVLANSTYPYSYVIYGSADGYTDASRDSFKARSNHGSVSVADLDGNGYLDLVWSNWSAGANGYSRIYWGGDDGFDVSRIDSLPTGRAHGNLVADFDADGYADILWVAYYANNDDTRRHSMIYWGGPCGFSKERFTELYSVGPGDDLSAADLDKDGLLDIVIPNRSSKPPPSWTPYEYSYIYYGEGNRGFRLDSVRARGAWGSSIADVNRDGWLDIAFAGSQSLLYYGSRNGFVPPQVIPMRFTSSVMLADFDANGLCDLALGRPLVTMVLLKVFYQKGRFWDEGQLDPKGGPDAGVTKDLGNPATRRDEAWYISEPIAVTASEDSVAYLDEFSVDFHTTWQGDAKLDEGDVTAWAAASPYPEGGNWGDWIRLEGDGPYTVAGKAFRYKLCFKTGFRTSVALKDVEFSFHIEGIPASSRIIQQTPRQFEIWLGSLRSHKNTFCAIYDLLGRRVRTLRPDRLGHAYWIGTDDAGRSLPSGVYFLILRTDKGQDSHKLVLLD